MIVLYPFFKDVIDTAFLPVNIIFSIGLLLCCVYWMFAIVGVLDFDLDIDIDTDVDVDTDIDVDAGGGGVLIAVLRFFNLDALPLMIFLSFFFLISCSLSILVNHYFGQNQLWFGVIAFFPIVLISAFVTKIFSTPLIPFFKSLNDVAKSLNMIGKDCEVIFGFDKGEISQGLVMFEEDRILISIESHEDAKQENFAKGEILNVFSKRKEGENSIYQVG